MVPANCLVSFQDENDNPPTFSKPAYFVSVVENIMAGTGRPGEGVKAESPQACPLQMRKAFGALQSPASRQLFAEHLLYANTLLGTASLLS